MQSEVPEKCGFRPSEDYLSTQRHGFGFQKHRWKSERVGTICVHVDRPKVGIAYVADVKKADTVWPSMAILLKTLLSKQCKPLPGKVLEEPF